MATYAYLRVSTDRQDVANQRHGILEYANTYGLAPIQLVEDATSGRMAWRERAIGQLLIVMARAGDVVLFAEVSRMARSTLQVLEMLAMGMERKLHMHIAKQRMILDGSLNSRIAATVLGLAAETVPLWFGLYDEQLFVEHGARRYGPYARVSNAIPLHRYRRSKKTRTEQRADRIESLAEQLALPRAALSTHPTLSSTFPAFEPGKQPFRDPDPFHELAFPSALDAKRAIADRLGLPLAKLSSAQLEVLNALLTETLTKKTVRGHVRHHLEPFYRG